MKKAIIFILLIPVILLSGCSLLNTNNQEVASDNSINLDTNIQLKEVSVLKKNQNKPQLANQVVSTQNSFIADSGAGGWEKMSLQCEEKIITRDNFKSCLINKDLGNFNFGMNEISDGYIEIGSMKSLNMPTSESIKVFIHYQWAVDESGNLYLFGQLG